jgi:hypothetical protein
LDIFNPRECSQRAEDLCQAAAVWTMVG